jgi:hypothetical protein
MEVWKHPGNYGGFSPDGDYLVLAQNRDSDTVARSNWAVACQQLDAKPHDCGDDAQRPPVYHWRASHWLCGWVEYLMVRADAPQDVIDKAQELVDSLEDYPVLDDDHLSELEVNEACEYWQRCSVRERVDLLEGTGISVFAARRDEFPSDDDGSLMQRINGY